MLRNFLKKARSGGSDKPTSPGWGLRSRTFEAVMGWRENHIIMFSALGFCGMIVAGHDRGSRIPFELRAVIVLLSGCALIYAAALLKWGDK